MELLNVDRHELARITREALRQHGLTDREVNVSGWGHDGPENTVWKWKTDSSCGLELTSPVLQGWKGLHELRIMMDTVDRWGDQHGVRLVNKKCGVHVHVDSRDLDFEAVKTVALGTKVWEPIFLAMNPLSRKGNHYCREVEFPAEQVKNATNKSRLHDAWESFVNTEPRYHGLNLEPWWGGGSIEFRYFSGTWAFEKATAAVMMSVLFIQAAKLKRAIRISPAHLRASAHDIWQMAGRIGLDKYADRFFRDFLQLKLSACPAFKELRKFVKARIATFYNPDGTPKGIRRR